MNAPHLVLTSRADVRTDAPARYAKQLVSHLGRKVEFATEGAASTARFGETTGQVIVADGVLTLLASGTDPEGVARVEHVLGSHLERFGRRGELVVSWTRTSAEAAR
jgi:uncharacterized protein